MLIWQRRCWSGPGDVVQSDMVWNGLVRGFVCSCWVLSVFVEYSLVSSLFMCCLVWSGLV